MNVRSCLKNYYIYFDSIENSLKNIKQIDNSIVIVDSNVYGLYKKIFRRFKNLLIIKANENSKVLDTALKICDRIVKMKSKRNTTLISFGGGITQDITGYVASVMYRGIRWIYFPTTLLSACDSCIGGKTSLNYKKYKNLLGTFFPPDKIYISSEFFHTLSNKDINSGLGEIAKFSIMQGNKSVSKLLLDLKKLKKCDEKIINYYINKSLKYKKQIIEKDEFDRGDRIKLNYAHTFAHAIETITSYKIPHGTAVAIGCIIANYISLERKYLSIDFVTKCNSILLDIIDVDRVDLLWNFNDFIKIMHKDKKQINKKITAVLVKDDKGNVSIVSNLTNSEIKNAIIKFYKLMGVKNDN